MAAPARRLFVVAALSITACGGGDEAAGPGSGGPVDPSNGEGGAGSDGGKNDGGDDDGFTPVYGKFGAPEATFTIPVTAPTPGKPAEIYLPTITSKYPDVDWSKLDRLYIPAGTYKTVLLGGLPVREASRPLIITNLGGQVKIGSFAAGYAFSIGGGANWILTGRYDPVSKTGDAGFRGHAEGDFAGSRGKYGIFVDDAFSQTGLSGISVGGKATDFEIEVVEVARAEFAGIVAKTDNDGSATMKNVRLHDAYIHDTGSEAIYFGSTQAQPQHAFEKLAIYDNRMIRAGTEVLQVGQLGDGCEIHHNVLGPGAVRWRSSFADYQDGNVQYGQRYGSSSFHHNIVIGTGDLFVEFMPQHVDGDAHGASDTVTFADNYFSDTSSGGVYTHATANDVTLRFERNVMRGFNFNYAEVYPDAKPSIQAFGVGAGTTNRHVLADNKIDATFPFLVYTQPVVTATNNTQGAVPRVAFRDFMGAAIDENYRRVEWWTDRATRSPTNPKPVVAYKKGAFVVHQGALYEALEDNVEKQPGANPAQWKALPQTSDDVRLVKGSSGDLGIRWPPPKS